MCTCVAWDPDTSHDGPGAQVLRIIDSFSAAKYFNLGFVYIPIAHFERNPGDGLKEDQKAQFLFDLDKFLNLDRHSCTNLHEKKIIKLSRWHVLPSFTRWYFFFRRILNWIRQRNELMIIPNIYMLTHKNPDIRRTFVLTRVKKQKNQSKKNPLHIHVHIRRAFIDEIFFDRVIPTSWYLSILITIQNLFEHNNVESIVTLHTDVSKQNEKWDASDISERTEEYISENGGKFKREIPVKVNYEDFKETMSAINNLRVVTNINPIEAWDLMAEADILILGKSTFSYVGALLCNPRIVISPQGFLGILSNWFSSNTKGELDSATIESLQELIDSRIKF